MKTEVRSTPISGLVELLGHPFSDHRGAFLNCFRRQEIGFASEWGDRPISQVNVSRTDAVGTVRGLHLQAAPHGEAKIVFKFNPNLMGLDDHLSNLRMFRESWDWCFPFFELVLCSHYFPLLITLLRGIKILQTLQ